MPEKPKQKRPSDDFQSVARRLECDPDMEAFDSKLRKIAKVKASPLNRDSRFRKR